VALAGKGINEAKGLKGAEQREEFTAPQQRRQLAWRADGRECGRGRCGNCFHSLAQCTAVTDMYDPYHVRTSGFTITIVIICFIFLIEVNNRSRQSCGQFVLPTAAQRKEFRGRSGSFTVKHLVSDYRSPSHDRAVRMGVVKHVAVVGGGFVGLSCALQVQRAGHRVTLLERAPTVSSPSSASYGNAGTFAAYANVPVNKPGIVWDLPRMLTSLSSPLSIKPTPHLLKMVPWFYHFLRCTSPPLCHLLNMMTCILRILASDSACTSGIVAQRLWIIPQWHLHLCLCAQRRGTAPYGNRYVFRT
jgi:hypothetical protein